MIKAIKTNYNGTFFRSKLEANIAFLMDNLQIKWLYEPISFLLSDGTHYMPDFFLENQSAWLECRGYKTNKGNNQINIFINDLKNNILKSPLRFLSQQFIVFKHQPICLIKNKIYSELYVSKCSHCNTWQFNNIESDCLFCSSKEFSYISGMHLMDDGKIYFNNIFINNDFSEQNSYIPLQEWIQQIKDSC